MSDTGASLSSETDPRNTMASLRERGADRLEPVRFRFIEALARRAEPYRGAARQLLDDKLARALTEYMARVEIGPPDAGTPDQNVGTDDSNPLRQLVAELEGQTAARKGTTAATVEGTHGSPPAELKSLSYFRDTWSKLSVEHQLAQALAQGPENAGPLNSHLLVLESLKLMRDVSPDYLNRFMSYVDALLWLDQADGTRMPAAKEAVRREKDGKQKSGRARARQSGA